MDQEKTYKWIQDRLRDLHSGTLSESDRARLFELSKNDPFLKDALEGYQSVPGHDHLSRLHTISHRIQHKRFAKRRKLFPSRSQWAIQAIAASMLLLLVTWAVIYYTGLNNNTATVASNADQISIHDSVIAIPPAYDTDADLAMEESVATELNEEPAGLRANAQSKQKEALSQQNADKSDAENISDPKRESLAYETTNKKVEEAPASGIKSQPGTATSAQESDRDGYQNPMAKYNARDEALHANAMPPALMRQRVTGQIIDAFGQPVTGAVVAILNTNLITTSDIYGQFELFIPAAQSAVEIFSSGYKDTLMNVSQGQENIIVVLSPLYTPTQADAAYQKMESQKTSASTVYMNNTLSFQEYVKSNSVYPIQTQYISGSHPVTLQFTVAVGGKPQNIKTIQSQVDSKFHTEAVRLVENGPLWKCEKYPCKKEYTIYFQ